jgi:DNA processing protein
LTRGPLVNTATHRSLNDEERLDWLRLIRSDNVGPHTFHQLVQRYGSVRAALDALPELARRGGAVRIAHVCSRAQAQRELARMQAAGIALLAVGEADYPARLQVIDDAPPLLAMRGRARNASAAGMRFADRLARALADAGGGLIALV